MSLLEQIGEGLSQTWNQLSEGWREFMQRAGRALTRFRHTRHAGDLQTREDQFLSLASEWAVLPAEVRETRDTVEVRLEVPGMEAADFDISVLGNELIVRGVKQVESESTEGRYHVLECAYGEFERIIPLPVEVDDARARARYRRGILRISLPKLRRGGNVKVTVES